MGEEEKDEEKEATGVGGRGGWSSMNAAMAQVFRDPDSSPTSPRACEAAVSRPLRIQAGESSRVHGNVQPQTCPAVQQAQATTAPERSPLHRLYTQERMPTWRCLEPPKAAGDCPNAHQLEKCDIDGGPLARQALQLGERTGALL